MVITDQRDIWFGVCEFLNVFYICSVGLMVIYFTIMRIREHCSNSRIIKLLKRKYIHTQEVNMLRQNSTSKRGDKDEKLTDTAIDTNN